MTWLKIDDDHDMLWVDDDAHAMHMIYATITLGCYRLIHSDNTNTPSSGVCPAASSSRYPYVVFRCAAHVLAGDGRGPRGVTHFPMLLDIGAAAAAVGLWKRRCRRRVKRWRGRRCASGGEADDVSARWVEELSWGPDKGGGKRDQPASLGSCRRTSLV